MTDLDSDRQSRKRDRTEDRTERKSKKGIRYKDDHAHKRHKRKQEKKEHVKIIDEDDDEVWIEKNIDGETVRLYFVSIFF